MVMSLLDCITVTGWSVVTYLIRHVQRRFHLELIHFLMPNFGFHSRAQGLSSDSTILTDSDKESIYQEGKGLRNLGGSIEVSASFYVPDLS